MKPFLLLVTCSSTNLTVPVSPRAGESAASTTDLPSGADTGENCGKGMSMAKRRRRRRRALRNQQTNKTHFYSMCRCQIVVYFLFPVTAEAVTTFILLKRYIRPSLSQNINFGSKGVYVFKYLLFFLRHWSLGGRTGRSGGNVMGNFLGGSILGVK